MQNLPFSSIHLKPTCHVLPCMYISMCMYIIYTLYVEATRKPLILLVVLRICFTHIQTGGVPEALEPASSSKLAQAKDEISGRATRGADPAAIVEYGSQCLLLKVRPGSLSQ